MAMDTRIPIEMECTLFFQQNPFTLETDEGIALRLGRHVADVRPALSMLVDRRILEQIGEGKQAIYRYVEPEFATWDAMVE